MRFKVADFLDLGHVEVTFDEGLYDSFVPQQDGAVNGSNFLGEEAEISDVPVELARDQFHYFLANYVTWPVEEQMRPAFRSGGYDHVFEVGVAFVQTFRLSPLSRLLEAKRVVPTERRM